MKPDLKHLIKFFKRSLVRKYFLFLISLLFFQVNYAQDNSWHDIELIDTMHYSAFNRNPADLPNYPPSHLFDGDYSTCWVARADSDQDNPYLFLRMPDNPKILNVFPGYGKSESLFYKNARPSKIKLSIYGAVNPVGYVSEIATLYKAVKFSTDQLVSLKDTGMIQHIPLEFSTDTLKKFQQQVRTQFSKDKNIPIASSSLIMKMEILEINKGSTYDDICISELFFTDRYIPFMEGRNKDIHEVSINEEENKLITTTTDNQQEVAYSDKSSVLQLIEVSRDKKWAILISMPSEIQGRVETNYLLVNLEKKKVVNKDLEKTTGDYLSGNELFFEYDDKGNLFLNYYDQDFNEMQIELK